MVTDKKNRIGMIFVHIFLLSLVLIMILPIILLLMSSLTDEQTLISYGYSFFPKKFSLAAYEYITKRGDTIVQAYKITLLSTFIGTAISAVMTSMLAYGLSLKNLPGRNVIAFMVFFTMLFNGGLVPSYMIYSNIFHIKETFFALIVPNFLMNAFNVMLVRTYFVSTVPEALYEAAKIDGANHFRIYGQIVLPLSKPILVSTGLFTALGYWNDWTNSLYYIQERKELWGIQSLLNKMITDMNFLTQNSNLATNVDMSKMPTVSVTMAIAFVGLLPLLVVFPFLQKYFVKGIAIGAVKG